MCIKKLCCFLISVVVSGTISIHAFSLNDTIPTETVTTKKTYPLQPTIVKTSITGFLWGGVFPFTSEYRMCVEIPTGKKQSDQVAVSIIGKNIFWKAIDKAANVNEIIKVSGYRLQYEHKFYLGHHRNAPYGFYLAPHVSYTNAKIALGLNRYYHQSYFDVRHFNWNILLGVQRGRIGRVSMDISGGFGYKTNSIYYHANSYTIFKYDATEFGEYYNNHFHMMFDMSICYSL
jgi:hypothetical protein